MVKISASKYKTKKLIHILVQMSILIITIILLNLSKLNESYINYSIIIFANFILSYYNLYLMRIKLLGIPSLFILFNYIFHFGQIIIFGFFPAYKSQRFDFVSIIGYHELWYLIMFSLAIINLTTVGILISTHLNKEINEVNNKTDLRKMNKIFFLGKCTTIAFMPFFLIIASNSIINASQYGYGSANRFQGAGIISAFGFFIYSGFYLMSYASLSVKTRNKIHLMATLFSLVLMISGERARPLTFLITLIVLPKPNIDIKSVKRNKFSSRIMSFAIMYFIVILINAIFSIRNQNISITSIISAIEISFDQSPLIVLLEELGGTIYTLYITMIKVPTYLSPGYGTTYISSISTIFPNINGVLTNLNLHSHFVYSLKTSSLGGSYIAELYYNFLNFSYLFALIFGYITGKIFGFIDKTSKNENAILLAVQVQLSAYILWWSRDAFMSIVRPVVYCYIMMNLLLIIVTKINFRSKR